MEGALCFIISYFTIRLLSFVVIFGYALETRRFRDVGLSFAHGTRVLHMIIRYLASSALGL